VDWDAWKQSEIGTSVLTGVEGFLDTYHHFLKQANERHEEKHALENEYYERCREEEMQEQWEQDEEDEKQRLRLGWDRTDAEIKAEDEEDNEESDNDRWDREQEQRERWELKDQDESDKLMMEKEQAEEKHKKWLDQALTTLRKNTPEDSHYQEENLDRVRGQAYDPYAEEPEDRDYPEEQTGE
jgi:hypothetical protein